MEETASLQIRFQQAWQYHLSRDLVAAEHAYLVLLSARSSWPQVQSLLGAVYLETGRFEQARSLLADALSGGAEDLETYINYAGVLTYLGDLEPVPPLLAHLHQRAPDSMAVLELDLHYYFKRGDWVAAKVACQTLLKQDPDHRMALQTLAQCLLQENHLDEARALLRSAVERFPDALELGLDWGGELLKQRHTRELAELHAHLLDLYPKDVRLLLQQAMQARQAKDEARFCTVLDQILETRPDDPKVKQIFIDYLIEKGRYGEVLRELYTLAEGLPQASWFTFYLSILSHLQGHHAVLNKVRLLQKDRCATKLDDAVTLGVAAYYRGDLLTAMEELTKHINAHPSDFRIRFILSMVHFLLGDYGSAWDAYEARCAQTADLVDVSPVPGIAPWDGESGSGKRILVFCEQGLGDVIQFIRYLPALTAQQIRPVLLINHYEQLLPLFVIDSDEQQAEPEKVEEENYDFQIPLLSLPKMLGLQQDAMANLVPYLQASPLQIQRWHSWLRTLGSGLKVGLVWAGNPKHLNDPHRSMDLSLFDTLSSIPGIRWIHLQVGPSREDAELTGAHLPLIELPEPIQTLADTAALIDGLDLILAVDTSVAHLAGAMGRPVWVLLPFLPDWRWGMKGDTSRWYPTMTLFRQKQAGEWSDVMARVADQLLRQVRLKQNLSPLQHALLGEGENWSGVEAADLVAACPILLRRHVTESELLAAGWTQEQRVEFRIWQAIQGNKEAVWPTSAWKHLSRACCCAAWEGTQSLSAVERLRWLDAFQSHRTLPVSDFWRAQVLLVLQRYEEAHKWVHPLGEKVPRHLPFHLLSFQAMEKLGAKAAALHFAQRAVHYAPRNAKAWVYFLHMLLRYRLPEPVQDLLQDVAPLIEKEEGYPVIRAHLAMLLAQKEEAEQWWEVVLNGEPGGRQIELDRVEAALRLQRWDQAKHLCAKAEITYPQDQEFGSRRFNADMLSRGEVEDWTYYTYRFLNLSPENSPILRPVWQGESLKGRSLLVYSEQGFGDHIYFSKCLAYLPSETYDLAFENPALARLLKYSKQAKLLSSQDFWNKKLDLHNYDYLASIADLPKLLGFAPLCAPPGASYLQASAERVAHWGTVLAAFQGLRVGLVWAGNPDYGRNEYRSMRLSELAPLAQVQGITFFSLQLGLAEREILFAPGGMKVLNLATDLNDFEESAAVLSSLDLLISVDTSIAHLAGALGVPVWMMLPHDCDFRWGASRLDCPWYPSMRIFRQPYQGCWIKVVDCVRTALIERVS